MSEGRSAIATRKAKAYAMVTTAIFTGKGKFSFDQYVGRHQQAHNELLFLEEPVAETKKVTDFLAGIRDPKLETADIDVSNNVWPKEEVKSKFDNK